MQGAKPQPLLDRPGLSALLALVCALGLHAVVLSALGLVKPRAPDAPAPPPLEIAVVDKPPPPPPPEPKREEPKPPPPVKMKLARAPRVPKPLATPPPKNLPPPPPQTAPPPPSTEAKTPTREVHAIAGFKLESTVQSGEMAAPTGNTLYGTPDRVARAPSTVKPYKAERYAPAAQVQELPSVLNRESVDIRKFYPPDALKQEFEGEVILRLLIDSDGSIAKVDVISDPGRGLGPAALRAVREFRFAPGKVNGTAVATTVPFTIRFQIN